MKPISLPRNRRWMLPVSALVLILAANLVLSPGFFAVRLVDGHFFGSTIDILHRAAPLGFVALGMAVVIATGGIDLSVGAIIAICGATAAVLLRTTDLPPALVLLAALGVGLLCGLWNGFLVAFLEIQPIVATLILMVAGRGIAQMITGGQIVTFHSGTMDALGGGHFLALPARVWLLALFAVVLGIALRRTALGLFLEAVGGNASASRLAGIEARWVRLSAYGLSGLCSGLAGLILAADIRGADANNAGLWLELDAILAVVIGGASLIGGRFSLGLTLIGALVIQSLTTSILVSGLPPQYTLVVKAAVILLILFLQSPRLGLLGFARR